MRRWKIASLSLVAGGVLLLAGCSFQFQPKRGGQTTGEVIEAPTPDVQEAAKAEEELIITHTVVKGETLWDIAGYDEIYGDPLKWKLIYEANRDILNSPDALKLGQVLIIPRE